MRTWKVTQTRDLEVWFIGLDEEAKEDIRASIRILSQIGPTLGRPHVDTLTGTTVKNLKELRVQSKGRPFRIILAFDPSRSAVLLIGGNKEGDDRFYEVMIPVAENLYKEHLKKEMYHADKKIQKTGRKEQKNRKR